MLGFHEGGVVGAGSPKHPFWTRWGFSLGDIKLETRWGRLGDREAPYQTVLSFGKLRLHCFHRGDHDPDPHDHMWDFKTFPLTSYVEEVLEDGVLQENFVKSRKWHSRPAEYAHRVLHRAKDYLRVQMFNREGELTSDDEWWIPCAGRIWTILVVGNKRRDWGFVVRGHAGPYTSEVTWVPWRTYVYGEKHG